MLKQDGHLTFNTFPILSRSMMENKNVLLNARDQYPL